jgi:hypothetical protein
MPVAVEKKLDPRVRERDGLFKTYLDVSFRRYI